VSIPASLRSRIVVAAAGLWLAGCGYVGEPLPPSLNLPARVADLAAVQRGAKLLFRFTLPDATTDGVLLRKTGAVDLRIGPAGDERWFEAAPPIPVTAAVPGPAQAETAANGWAGREIVCGVRVANARGRWSEWSNLVRLRVVEPLPAPVALEAGAVPEGVRLRWRLTAERNDVAFRIFRRAGAEKDMTQKARVAAFEWVDADTRYRESYRYQVQAVTTAGDAEAESETSATVEITPEDRFPPATPTGLAAVAGLDSIELSWDRNREDDLAGYRIYRAIDDGPMERLGGLLATPSFSDRTANRARPRRYAVTAVDQIGNESARSAPVEATLP